MITALATQEELTSFKRALDALSANLDYHVNSSLSLAHGIALIHGPADDGDGNDLRLFKDERGHAISGTNTSLPNHIRFVINGVAYYAPCVYTDPGAQSATTGSVVLTPPVVDRPTTTALVTSYVGYETQAVNGANDELLRHIGITHQGAHIPITVVPFQSRALDNDIYASHLLYFQFRNKLYSIPVHTRLGGPSQLMRGINVLARISTKDNTVSSSHDDKQKGTFYVTEPTSGTYPYTVVYELSTLTPTFANGVVSYPEDQWTALDDTSAGWHVASTANTIEYDISAGLVLDFRTYVGSDDSRPVFLLRARITNSSGTTYSNYGFMRANDEDGNIFGGPDSSYKTEWRTIIGSPPIT